jgi:hypothetical protein
MSRLATMTEKSSEPSRAPASEHGFRASWYLVARLIGYAIAVGLVFQAVVVAARHGAGATLAVEDGPLETLQLVLALVSAALLFVAAARAATASRAFTFLGLVCGFFAVRELDHVLDVALWHGAWKWLAAPLVAGALYLVWRTRSRLGDEILALTRTPTFYLAFFGFVVIVVYAQVLGQKQLWQAVMGDRYQRPVKDMIEEATELFGYLVLTFAALEAVVHARRSGSAGSRSRVTGTEDEAGTRASW